MLTSIATRSRLPALAKAASSSTRFSMLSTQTIGSARSASSTRSAGVSSSYLLWPTRLCEISVRVSMPGPSLRFRPRPLQACGPVGVLDEAQRFQIVDGAGLERRTGFEAIDEMRDDAIEARL